MNAIVTVAIGGPAREICSVSVPFMRDYAAHCRADFVLLDEERVKAGHPKFEKLQLHDLLSTYARIVYLDVDIIVMPHCRSLFELVPPDRFGAFFDSEGGNGDAEIGLPVPDAREQEIAFYQENYGDIGWSHTYFNSGVMVASAAHRDIFDYSKPARPGKRFIDQTHLNYRLQEGGHKWCDIGQTYNHFVGLNRSKRLHDTRFQSNILHYAGFAEFYEKPTLIEKMREDAAIVASGRYRADPVQG